MNIQLGEFLPDDNISRRVQVAKTGVFNHETYGLFSITLSDLERMKINFDSNARRQKIDGHPVLPFDYKHEEDDKAAGWITELDIDKDSNGIDSLFAEVKWTPKGAEKVRGEEFKFVSPSIRRNYRDAETGVIYDVILKGATLTNVPFLRDMEAVYLLSEDKQKQFLSLIENQETGKKMPTIDEIKGALVTMPPEEKKQLFEALGKEMESAVMEENTMLSEKLSKSETDSKKLKDDLKLSEKTIHDLKENMENSGEMSDRLKLAEDNAKDLGEKVTSLTKTLADNKRTADFDTMLSEGKVCEAQRKPFMAGDMSEFAKNAQEVKLDETGKRPKGDDSGDAQGKFDKKLELLLSENKGMEYGEAVSQTLLENPKLSQELGY